VHLRKGVNQKQFKKKHTKKTQDAPLTFEKPRPAGSVCCCGDWNGGCRKSKDEGGSLLLGFLPGSAMNRTKILGFGSVQAGLSITDSST
jgi:hypothetical protein